MKKAKRFDEGGNVGKFVPRDLAEEDSSLDVNYDKVPGLGAATGRARENTVIPKSAGIAARLMPSKPTPPRSRSDLSAVTGLDKKLSTRAGRELSDEDRQANTERIADMASKIPMVAAGSLAIPRMTQAGLTAAKLAEQYILPSPRGMSSKEPKNLMDESRGYKKGGKVSSASSRGDGIAQRGKTRGKMR
jgi:hypothetical protein